MRPSNRVENIPRSGIRAIFDQARGIPDLVHLELGEPDFRIPDHATEAAIQALSEGFTKYTPNAGIEDLRQAISEKLKRENEIDADSNGEIMVTAGAMEALSLSILCTVDQGDEVLIPDPGYVSYLAHVLLAGGVPIFVPLREQNDFRMRAEDIESLITKKTRMIIVNSPSNPTGAVELQEDLKGIADLAQHHDLLVLSDEPYERLVYKGNVHHSIAALPGMLERTVSIFSFSKTYAMTGMRIGYIASGRELIQQMIKMQEHYVGSINSPAQKAAIAALRGPQTCVANMLSEYTRRREILIDGLNDTGVITCKKPAGTFYAFPNITKTGFDSETFAEKLLREAKVVTVPGVAFGNNGKGHLRLSFATSMDNVIEAVKRIGDYCIKIN
ncbi:MAG: pyridoxal phosphate-dependent aminotransferase [Candidatus Bathyarchaeia archaeon]